MRTRFGGWSLLVGLICTACAGGMTVSPSCAEQVRQCLATCPASRVEQVREGPLANSSDARTDCERRCQRTCLP